RILVWPEPQAAERCRLLRPAKCPPFVLFPVALYQKPMRELRKERNRAREARRPLSSYTEAHRTWVEKSTQPGLVATRQQHMLLRLCKLFAVSTRQETYSPSLGRFAHYCYAWERRSSK